MKQRFLSHQGFTFLEVLIAIGILAGMSLMMVQVLNGMIAGRNQTEERAGLQHHIQVGLSKIYDDVNMAFLADNTFHGNESQYVTGFDGEQNAMSFSTTSHVHYIKNKRDTDHVHVSYFLQNNDEGHQDLMRKETDYLREKIGEGGQPYILIPNVKSFELEYYDSNKKDWGKKWDTDSVTSAGRLPAQVKVSLVVYGRLVNEDSDERREHSFEIIVPVPMYKQKISF